MCLLGVFLGAVLAAVLAACDGDGTNDLLGPSGDAPIAAFTVACNRRECTFRDRSADSDGTIRAYRWDFGDNSEIVTTQDAAHAYVAPGEFRVTLTITDDDGKGAIATRQVNVADPPLADFTADCSTLLCIFEDKSRPTVGSLTGWRWDFGDGGWGSTAQHPNHLYYVTEAREFSVTLTVTDADGETATVTKPVTIPGATYQPPTAAFSVSCAALACTFTDQSTGGILSIWRWDFGDGHTSELNEQNPVHGYDVIEATRFTVTLTACDFDIGCGSASREILITPDE